jgi:hypothetical protein
MRSLLCLGALLLAAPLAHAQALTIERDGATVTITRPDGTTERFTMEEDAPLHVRSESGTVIVEEADGARRRLEVRRGDAPRAFAFDVDGPRGSLRMALDLDSLAHELDGMRWLSRDVEGFVSERVLPGLRFRGVDAETRRALAEGERESRALARRAREADGTERARLEGELRDALERTFDLRQQARRDRAERLQEEAAEIREETSEREAARREIIERRQRELLGERDALDW